MPCLALTLRPSVCLVDLPLVLIPRIPSTSDISASQAIFALVFGSDSCISSITYLSSFFRHLVAGRLIDFLSHPVYPIHLDLDARSPSFSLSIFCMHLHCSWSLLHHDPHSAFPPVPSTRPLIPLLSSRFVWFRLVTLRMNTHSCSYKSVYSRTTIRSKRYPTMIIDIDIHKATCSSGIALLLLLQ
jgi:hypothetical protein